MPRPRRSEIRRASRRHWLRRRRDQGKPRRSWKRRLLISAVVLVVLVGALGGGLVLYAHWRYDQIHKVTVSGLTGRVPNKPFNILLVGSDSRAFVDNAAESAQFGNESDAGGQRSDVIIIARVVPATREVKLLSIPRDTWVNIPGSSSVAGPNRINAAFNDGPSLLIQTITNSFQIPISDYIEVNFPGFSAIVNSLGGVGLDFKYPVKDAYSGLNITETGCQIVNGTEALALVRSRHLYYYEDGEWNYDGDSDWSRIQRQDAFFRAVASKAARAASNPLTLNSLIGATTGDLTIDQTLSEGTVIDLAKIFHSFSASELETETLPTEPAEIGGADVLVPAPEQDAQVISSFLAFGTTPSAQTSAALRHAPAAPPASGASLTSAVLASTVTVTTLPGTPPIDPADVVNNTQPEPWNPTPCNP